MEDNFTTKDSGEREVYSTGAQRDLGENKGFFACLPFHATTRLAKIYERGAKKYNRNNYLKGMPLTRYADASIRHLLQYLSGNREEDHLIASIWNLLSLCETEHMINEGMLPKELADIHFPYLEENIEKAKEKLESKEENPLPPMENDLECAEEKPIYVSKGDAGLRVEYCKLKLKPFDVYKDKNVINMFGWYYPEKTMSVSPPIGTFSVSKEDAQESNELSKAAAMGIVGDIKLNFNPMMECINGQNTKN